MHYVQYVPTWAGARAQSVQVSVHTVSTQRCSFLINASTASPRDYFFLYAMMSMQNTAPTTGPAGHYFPHLSFS